MTIDTLLFPLHAGAIQEVLAPTSISDAELAILLDATILDDAINADGTAEPYVLAVILLANELARRLRDGHLSGPEVQAAFDYIKPELPRLFTEALERGPRRLDESFVIVNGHRLTFLRDAALLFMHWVLTPRRP
jgi:hypothetical protein